MTKDLVVRRALEDFDEMVSNQNVQIAKTQESTVNLNQENALVTQVAQQGFEAPQTRLAEATATSVVEVDSSRSEAFETTCVVRRTGSTSGT